MAPRCRRDHEVSTECDRQHFHFLSPFHKALPRRTTATTACMVGRSRTLLAFDKDVHGLGSLQAIFEVGLVLGTIPECHDALLAWPLEDDTELWSLPRLAFHLLVICCPSLVYAAVLGDDGGDIREVGRHQALVDDGDFDDGVVGHGGYCR